LPLRVLTNLIVCIDEERNVGDGELPGIGFAKWAPEAEGPDLRTA